MNLADGSITEVKYSAPAGAQIGRSGHTAVAYKDKMFVFGGILEVTKELNDLLSFDIRTKNFTVIDSNGEAEHVYHSRFDESAHQSALAGGKAGGQGESSSPTRGRKFNASPTKRGTLGNTLTSPNKKGATLNLNATGANNSGANSSKNAHA